MSSMPECKRCGNYIHHGMVICQDCFEKDINLLDVILAYISLPCEEEEVLVEIIKTLRDNPEVIIKRGKEEGWLK